MGKRLKGDTGQVACDVQFVLKLGVQRGVERFIDIVSSHQLFVVNFCVQLFPFFGSAVNGKLRFHKPLV